ncbi:MAG: glycosyltransferase family 2 protein, partial [Nanoarchaeota archaeon]
MGQPHRTGYDTAITVGIPVYNEERTLTPCLDAVVRAATRLRDAEIIVCFNGTTDNGREIARGFAQRHGNIRVIEVPKGKARAVKAIGDAAHGDIVVFTDGDAVIHKDALQHMIQPFADEAVVAVTGRPVPWPSKGWCHNIINARMIHPDAEIALTPINGIRQKPFIHGRLFALRRKIFHSELDGFEDALGDDTFLTLHVLTKYGRDALRCATDA